MFKFWSMIGTLVYCLSVTAAEGKAAASSQQVINVTLKEGSIKMGDLLQACPELKSSTPGEWHGDVVGKKVQLNVKLYRIRVFSYQTLPASKVSADIPFGDYIKNINFETRKSVVTHPVPELSFESFGSREAGLKDGVYFGLVLKEVNG